MNHRLSADDREFRRAFEACETAPGEFDHAAHVRLAYIDLCEHPVDVATQRMKNALLAFFAHLGIGQARYHETITIMLTHYSAEVLYSPTARRAFVEPDIEPIPGPGNRNAR
jgi:hypothetical protein